MIHFSANPHHDSIICIRRNAVFQAFWETKLPINNTTI